MEELGITKFYIEKGQNQELRNGQSIINGLVVSI